MSFSAIKVSVNQIWSVRKNKDDERPRPLMSTSYEELSELLEEILPKQWQPKDGIEIRYFDTRKEVELNVVYMYPEHMMLVSTMGGAHCTMYWEDIDWNGFVVRKNYG